MTHPRLILLGTGFGAFSLLKEIKTNLYDVKIISPRNYFLFTPLLPSTTVGTIEFRSIIEPIRHAKNMEYIPAICTQVEAGAKKIICRGAYDDKRFALEYDHLV